jgi:microcystin-dependent protein
MKKLLATLVMGVWAVCLHTAHAQTTAFNYTGYLLDGASPANGPTDFQFTLYSAVTNGTVLAGPTTLTNQSVNNGVFVVTLDFGGTVFNGSARWLEIAARPGGSGNPFTNSLPRQAINAVPYAIFANNGVPPGSVMAFMGTTVPNGWLLCDGSAVSRSGYAALYAVITNSSGAGNGSTTFNLPDMRGMFLRGVDGNANRDPDKASRTAPASGGNSTNAVGSIQSDEFKSHTHQYQLNNDAALNFSSGTHAPRTPETTGLYTTVLTQNAGGSETRPKNVYVNYIIKY